MKKIALFPGSFDPLTNGHLDTIERATNIFDEVIVAVSTNTTKKSLFNGEERIALAKEVLKDVPGTKVVRHTGGLTVDMAEELHVSAMLRGIRNMKDYEYEESIAMMNRSQNPKIETVILMASEKYRFLSSSLIKEVAMFGGDISEFVPSVVNQAIIKKYQDMSDDEHM
ncbi:pantetheine-phosphate adenylyltransferase [Jeotgalibaca sp. MA1X17-3]|uniref:pantetheine-phosphate adenylyltransferase n=1 Tax=Jeotgalibaca sp. MA1X17-3 TaxID=2908211 RepID=UPI001F3F6B5A|nr:pantetheine-phosphate adenylyltransferase [Jeotgalibaca sp. MA1X17-3]UJF14968.1 pantetheine-phosphate adenylyltransferase [Jeotgalibaca sp. MA1X17-3]